MSLFHNRNLWNSISLEEIWWFYSYLKAVTLFISMLRTYVQICCWARCTDLISAIMDVSFFYISRMTIYYIFSTWSVSVIIKTIFRCHLKNLNTKLYDIKHLRQHWSSTSNQKLLQPLSLSMFFSPSSSSLSGLVYLKMI